MARRSLKGLQDRINSEESKGNTTGGFFYPHWKLPFSGSTKVRLLEDPNEDNPFAVYVPFMEHKLNIGEEVVRIPCRRNLGKDHNCPICDLSKKFYDAGGEDNEDKGKYYYRDLYAVLRGVITSDGLEYSEDEESAKGKVKVLKFSFQIFNRLKVEIAKLEDDELFWDLDEGLDFEIVKDKQMGKGGKEYGKYDLSSGFVRRASAIPEEWREEIPDTPLSEILPAIPSYDEADEKLQEHLKSMMAETADSSDDDNTTSEEDLMEQLNRKRNQKKDQKKESEPEPTPTPKKKEKVEEPAPSEDDSPLSGLMEDDDDDDDGDILAQLNSD